MARVRRFHLPWRSDPRRRWKRRPAPAPDAGPRLARHRSAVFVVLLLVGAPLVLLALAHRLWIRRRGVRGLAAKLSGDPERSQRRPVPPGGILVHGVSLGEVNLMRPLVPRLEAALGRPCVLTTSTETGWTRLGELFPERDRLWWPLDLPWAVERFLGRTRPALVVLLELEIWPLFLLACQRRRIPVALVNARVGERSLRGYRSGGALLRPIFGGLRLALAQNGAWGARLVALGARRDRVAVSGSMKADMVRRSEPETATAAAAALGLDRRPLLLLASTCDGEEERLLDLIGSRCADWRIVCCPRHPERGAEVAAVAARRGFAPHRTSLGERLPAEPGERDLLIVDQIGKLADLYAWCAATTGLALVGGSFGSGRGGQNMLEAAAAGCCTAVGHDTRNFPDAMALLRLAKAITVLPADDTQALPLLAELLADPARRASVGTAAVAAWQAGRGATERALAALRSRLGRATETA